MLCDEIASLERIATSYVDRTAELENLYGIITAAEGLTERQRGRLVAAFVVLLNEARACRESQKRMQTLLTRAHAAMCQPRPPGSPRAERRSPRAERLGARSPRVSRRAPSPFQSPRAAKARRLTARP
jgi:hypothetical protein